VNKPAPRGAPVLEGGPGKAESRAGAGPQALNTLDFSRYVRSQRDQAVVAADNDDQMVQANLSYVHDPDSNRTFTIGAEFEYGSGSRGKPYTNSPPHL
jgi:hypothetical protein